MALIQDLLQVLDPADPFLTRTLDTANDEIELNVPLTLNRDAVINANLTVNGTLTANDEERVLVEDGYPYLNNGYTTPSAKTGGLVVNYLPTATTDSAAGSFTAGVNGVSNPSVTTTGSNTFTTGALIQISGANDPANNGLFEVLSHVGTTLEIRGVGLTAAQEDFSQTDFVTDATAGGTITQVNVSVIRTDANGDWETGKGSSSPTGVPIVFTPIGSGGSVDLQTAYENGETITTDAGNGSVTIGGTESLTITATGGLNVDTVADFDVSTFDVQMTGANGFSIDGTANSNISVANGNLTLSATGAGSDVIVSAADVVDIDGTTIDIDSSGASTFDAGTTLGLTGGTGLTATATSGNATLAATAGNAVISAGATVDVDGVTLDLDSTAATTIDAGTTLTMTGQGATSMASATAAASVTGQTDATVTATTGTAQLTATAGEVDLTAGTLIDMNAPALDADFTGTAEIDAQSLSLDATTSSNLTVTGNDAGAQNLTLSATNAGAGTGNVLVAADDEIDLTSDTLDMNVGTGNAAAAQLSAGGTDFFTADSTSGDEQLVMGTFTNIAGAAGIKLTAAVAVTAGDVLTLDSAGEVELADASAPALDGLAVGIALRSAAAAADVAVVTVPGSLVPVRFAAAPAAGNNGRPVYISGTAGLGTLTPPTGSGTTRFLVGFLQGADGVTTTPNVIYQPQYLSRTP